LSFYEIWHKFRSFCLNKSEQNEAERHFVQQNALFSALIISTTNFEQKYPDTLAELDNILQKVEIDYSHVQYRTVFGRMPL
jgi:hypothetical protein